jgi:co-chaperonin GroES (HSP10)
MKITPVGEKLLVAVIKKERVSEGGIVIPETEAKKYDHAQLKARLLAKGPLAFEAEKAHEKQYGRNCHVPEVGDTVIIAKYAGYEVQEEGQDDDVLYKIISDNDVTAVVSDE